MPDLYEVLGVQRNATVDAIRTAFREKAKLLHPDMNHGSSTAEFQKLNEAYQILSKPAKRHLYDLRLRYGVSYRVVYRRRASETYAENLRQSKTDYGGSSSSKTLLKTLDKFFFLSLFFAGLFATLFGIYMLFQEPVYGVNPFVGVIFGAIFTFGIGYGYLKWIRE
ncbi:MAG TPA: hypothetical protein DCM62_03960 [Bacteroidales bacterium]|nr:hypothetical protein [Bacteroidales bacterium]